MGRAKTRRAGETRGKACQGLTLLSPTPLQRRLGGLLDDLDTTDPDEWEACEKMPFPSKDTYPSEVTRDAGKKLHDNKQVELS
jgi:hypothetical protein